ncbi:MAG: PD-(D/E)XK nuclease family protein [Desulfobulbaceae bacterium]
MVFCPFLWYRGNYIKQAQGGVSCHDENKELILDLGSPLLEERKQQALAEELAEELRLAYVALTRARCRCYAFWADVTANKYVADSMDSALAWLLLLGEEHSFSEQVKILEDLAGNGSVACKLIPADSDKPVMLAARGERADELVSLTFTASNLHTDWLLHSYSSLAVTAPAIPGSHGIRPSLAVTAPAIPGSHGIRPSLAVAHHPEDQSRWSDRSEEDNGSEVTEAKETALLPDLPKGAQMGNVVHGLLEDIPFSTLASGHASPIPGSRETTPSLAVGHGYEETIKQQCAWFGVEAKPDRLAALLQKVVQTPLTPAEDGTTFCLADLEPSEIIKEMPFYFQLQPTARDGLMPWEPGMAGAASTTGQINTILAASRAVAPITPRSLQGYLTGFIDLICRYQGKFYIMDYKSNWLGNHLSDYGAEALEQAMREHNYGLQYWLYTLVLHRYLQNALENYAYASHFGGVMYLFIRGMEPTMPGSGVYVDLPDLATLERLDHCLGRTRDTEPSPTCGHFYGGAENG